MYYQNYYFNYYFNYYYLLKKVTVKFYIGASHKCSHRIKYE